jgi:hypothetical protein
MSVDNSYTNPLIPVLAIPNLNPKNNFSQSIEKVFMTRKDIPTPK